MVGLESLPERNVAVERERHRIHELGRVRHQSKEGDTKEFLINS